MSNKPYGFIAVSVGAGLDEIFKGLGVDYVIAGGQTMNPSTEDMLNAISHVHADTIYILPNNSNIILAAQQASSLVKDKRIVVVPSKTVPQGITAVLNFIPERSAEENAEAMAAEMANVKTGQVTYAVRNTVIDDREIHEGNIMGLGDHTILAVGDDIHDTTREMVDAMIDEDASLISIYYGQDVSRETAEALLSELEDAYPDMDVEIHSGGQPIYYYLVSVE